MSNNIIKLLDWMNGTQATEPWFAAACEEIRAAYPPEPEKPKVEPYKWPFTVSKLRSTGYASILDGTGYEICVVKGHRDEAARLNATIEAHGKSEYERGKAKAVKEHATSRELWERNVEDARRERDAAERRGYERGWAAAVAGGAEQMDGYPCVATPKVRGGE